MVGTMQDLLKKARVSWVISVDDIFSKNELSELEKSKKIYHIAENPEKYIKHFGRNIDIEILQDIDIDGRVHILKGILEKDENVWDELIPIEERTTPKLQQIVEMWKAQDLIKDCRFVPSVAETIKLLEVIPNEWKCDQNNRILWLIDRDFTKVGEGTEAGLDLIRLIAERELQDNICLLLTAKTDVSVQEVYSRVVGEKNSVEWINLASIVSKQKFLEAQDSSEVISQIIDGLWGNYNHLLVSQVANYLLKGLEKAKNTFLSLSSSAARHIIINFPHSEGVSVPETIYRILNNLTVEEFGKAYARDVQCISRLLMDYKELDSQYKGKTEGDSDLLFNLSHNEKYDYNVNILRQAISFGDIFEINNKFYILLSQPCDVAYRNEEGRNINEALLVKLLKVSESKEMPVTKHNSEPLKYFIKNSRYWLEFRDFRLISFNLLDLCVTNIDGIARISKEAVETGSLAEEEEYDLLPYDKKRFEDILTDTKDKLELWKVFNEVGSRLNDLARDDNDETDRNLARKYRRIMQRPAFCDLPIEKEGFFEYPIKRICKLKEPFSIKLYSEFSNYHSRIGLPGDYVNAYVTCLQQPDNLKDVKMMLKEATEQSAAAQEE